MAKAKVDSSEKFQAQDFDLFGALEALDRKDYGWFSRLTEEQQRKFVPYMLVHWMSAVKAKGLLSGYYVLSVDSTANRHLFSEYVQRHPELQWMMLCAASPGMGKQFHQWIPHLQAGVTQLRTQAKKAEVVEYFKKIYSGMDTGAIEDAACWFVEKQNFKVKLAGHCPNLRLDDIETLSAVCTVEELAEYEEQSGG